MADHATTRERTSERKVAGVSRQELERRWKLVRDHLRAHQIDALVFCSTDSLNNSGTIRWFRDEAPGYRSVIIFHADGPMTLVEHGSHGAHRTSDGNEPIHRGVGEIYNVGQFPAIDYTQSYEAKVVIDVLAKRGYKRLAVTGMNVWPHQFASMFTAAMEGRVELVDVTEFIDHCKAVKSAEELDMCRRAVAMQDAVWQAILDNIKPGMRDIDVDAIIQNASMLRGSTHGTIMVGSAAPGAPAPILQPYHGGRVFQQGDYLSILVESAGPGGWVAEVARTIVFGRADSELQDAFAKVCDAQMYTASLLKPGAAPAEVFAKYNDYAASIGLPRETRIHSHGQGLDIVERPLIRFDETMPLEANMFLAVHPGYHSKTCFAFVCDNTIIGADGASPWMHTTPQKIYEL